MPTNQQKIQQYDRNFSRLFRNHERRMQQIHDTWAIHRREFRRLGMDQEFPETYAGLLRTIERDQDDEKWRFKKAITRVYRAIFGPVSFGGIVPRVPPQFRHHPLDPFTPPRDW